MLEFVVIKTYWCVIQDGDGGDNGIIRPVPAAAYVPVGLIVGGVICGILFLIVVALVIANIILQNRRQSKRQRNSRLLEVKEGERRNKTALHGWSEASDINRSGDSSDVGTMNPGFAMPDSAYQDLAPPYEDVAHQRSDGKVYMNSAPDTLRPYNHARVTYTPNNGLAYQPKPKEDYDRPNLQYYPRDPGDQQELTLRPDTLGQPWEPTGGDPYVHASYQQDIPPTGMDDGPPLQKSRSITGSGSLLPYLSLTGVGAQDHPDLEFVQTMSNGHTPSYEGSAPELRSSTGKLFSEV